MSAKVTPINETEQSRVLSLVQQQLNKNVQPLMDLSDSLDFDKYGGIANLLTIVWNSIENSNAEFLRDLERRLGNV